VVLKERAKVEEDPLRVLKILYSSIDFSSK
jgi:hypothetical protein